LSPTWLKRLSESGYSRCVFSTVRNTLSSATLAQRSALPMSLASQRSG
jgi:hypothetical protein